MTTWLLLHIQKLSQKVDLVPVVLLDCTSDLQFRSSKRSVPEEEELKEDGDVGGMRLANSGGVLALFDVLVESSGFAALANINRNHKKKLGVLTQRKDVSFGQPCLLVSITHSVAVDTVRGEPGNFLD
jgi:hypothetical protein